MNARKDLEDYKEMVTFDQTLDLQNDLGGAREIIHNLTVFLASDHAPPCIAHRMDLSSRCRGNPHIPATPVLLGSGPAAEKPLPRGQAQLPT